MTPFYKHIQPRRYSKAYCIFASDFFEQLNIELTPYWDDIKYIWSLFYRRLNMM